MVGRVGACLFSSLLFLAPGVHAAIINVPAGGDLQAALDQAQRGDVVRLAPGAIYVGNFVLPAKAGAGFIIIRSDAPDSTLPADGERITPAYASRLPKLQAPANAGGTPPLSTSPGASYYIIQFIEFLPNPSGVGSLLALGSAERSQNSLSVVPHDLIVDRCYLHGYPDMPQLRGIALNSAATTIENSYIADIKAAGSDSQAIAGWNGPGPFKILNNYLEAAGENFLMGGSSMFIPDTTPTGIEFRHNHVTKQPGWRGSPWVVKNLFELKHAQDVIVDGNVFEYNWVAAQPGYAILFTPRNQYGDNLWSVVQRVSFTNNVVRHVSSAVNVLGWDNEHPSRQTNHITIRNNLFEDVDAGNWGGDGRLLQISETPDVTVDHNTVLNSGSAVYAYNTTNDRFVFTNNIVNASYYGISGGSTGGSAATAIAMYFPGGSFTNNLFVACSSPGTYPAGNYFPAGVGEVGFVNQAGGDYRLASSSVYKNQAADGRDPGADVNALNAALSGPTTTPPEPPPPEPPPPEPPPSPSPDSAPTVWLTSPADGSHYRAQSSIVCSADATDGDATPVARVDFYADGSLIGTATAAPFALTWTGATPGSYALSAVATDTAGLRAVSPEVRIVVAASRGPVTPSTLPAAWHDQDVGVAGPSGFAIYANGTFAVSGAGADVWGTTDAFHFVYQLLQGDGQFVARVLSMQSTGRFARAGVMIRESLAANAAAVVLDLTPAGIELLARPSTGALMSVLAAAPGASSTWLRLLRAGRTIVAYRSSDAVRWTVVGTASVDMASSVYVGLAVCSHDETALNSASFDQVALSITQAVPRRPVSYSTGSRRRIRAQKP